MFIKSVVALAVAAVAAAQTTNYIQFTNPVGTSNSYTGGENTTFSWINPCVAPYTRISSTPTKTEVQLLNATNSNNSFYLATVGYIDCSGTGGVTQGNPYWTVPASYADSSSLFALSIVVSPVTYSGTFKILPAGGSTTPSTSAPATKPTSAAAAVAAPILSAAAVVASAAYMLL